MHISFCLSWQYLASEAPIVSPVYLSLVQLFYLLLLLMPHIILFCYVCINHVLSSLSIYIYNSYSFDNYYNIYIYIHYNYNYYNIYILIYIHYNYNYYNIYIYIYIHYNDYNIYIYIYIYIIIIIIYIYIYIIIIIIYIYIYIRQGR